MNQAVKPKKVLYVITKATWGGAQKYVYDLATNLPKDVTPIVALGGNGILKEKLETHKVRVLAIPDLQRDVSVFKELKALWFLVVLFRKEKPDAVHLNSSKAAGLGALAARIARVPKIIFTVHGWPFKEDRNTVARACIYAASWLTAFFSTATIVVSKTDETLGKRMWIVGKKIKYIPLGIATINTLKKDEACAFLSDKIHKTMSARTPVIGTVAELTKNKGLEYGIEAVLELRKKHKMFLYIIVGDGELRGELEEKVQRLGLENVVFFAGFIANAEKYLNAFDYFLLPSVKEGLPYVLLEASVTARPIVATDVGGIPEILKDYEKGMMVTSKNPSALANAIIEMENQTSIADLEQIDRTLKRFSLSVMLEKTNALYDN
ncbi:MAG TPA: glycosyltransferase [Candidatus Paceibacterota bacterium]